MATSTPTPSKSAANANAAAKPARKAPPALVDRMKNQLTTATLREKLTKADVATLEAHLGILKALIPA